MAFNHGTNANITALYVNEYAADDSSNSINSWLADLGSGDQEVDIRIVEDGDPSNFVIVRSSASTWLTGSSGGLTEYAIAVTHTASTGTSVPFSNGDTVTCSFNPVGQKGQKGAAGGGGGGGSKGQKGQKGATGSQGPTGSTGPTGPQGSQGPAGPQGSAGDKGATGAQGPSGTGPTGPTGPAGPSGSKGQKGATGSQGPAGPPGDPGDPGGGGCHFPPGTCFAPGTPIMLADGSTKPIEEIEDGEEILVYNVETGEYDVETLEHGSYATYRNHFVDLHFDDGSKITSTHEHPYLTSDKEWAIVEFEEWMRERYQQDTVFKNIKLDSVLGIPTGAKGIGIKGKQLVEKKVVDVDKHWSTGDRQNAVWNIITKSNNYVVDGLVVGTETDMDWDEINIYAMTEYGMSLEDMYQQFVDEGTLPDRRTG
jgi:hypothetical protein